MELTDFYKLAYQASMGMSHLLANSHAEEYFYKEFDLVAEISKNDLLENIHPEKIIYRIYLDKSKELGIEAELVWQSAVMSAEIYPPQKEKLMEFWEYTLSYVNFARNRENNRLFSIDEIDSFQDMIRMHNYPLLHHSEIYRNNYKPSYRLIHEDVIEKYLKEYYVK